LDNYERLEETLKAELLTLKGDNHKLEDCVLCSLGMVVLDSGELLGGILAPGWKLDRMRINSYDLRQATEGLAYLG